MAVSIDLNPILTTVESTVGAGFARAQTYANDAVLGANTFLSTIASIANTLPALPNVNVTLTPVANAVQAYVAPVAPVEPSDLTVTLQQAPAGPTLTPVTPLSVGNVPEFTDTPLPIVTPNLPSPLTASAPTKPTLNAVAIPVAPDFVLPTVPSLLGYTIPSLPVLNIPSFTGTISSAPTAPNNTFAFTEANYTSTLLTSMKTLLQSWVDGAHTGLDPDVESQIWNRSRSRTAAVTARAAQKVLKDFASRGFAVPPGAMSIALSEAAQEAQDADIAQSREVAINQANLEQTNRRFAIEQALQTETQLIGYANNVAQRSFEAAKFTQQVAIDIFREMVAAYQADGQVYQSKAQVFKTLIDAELSKLEAYKSELEGQKLIGELNTQQVEIYKGRLAGVEQLVSIFKTQLDAANLSLSGNKLLLEGFASEISAYDTTVRAKATEYQAYESQWRGEGIKADIYGKQTDAFKSRTQAFQAGAEAQARVKDVEIKLGQEIPLAVHREALETYRIGTEAEVSRAGAVAKVLDSRVQLFDAKGRGEGTRVNAEVSTYKAASDVAIAQGNLAIESLKANLTALLQKINLLIEAARAGATVEAQLAASALSGVNLSMGLHAQGSASLQASASDNTQTSTNTSTQYIHTFQGE